MSFTQIPNFLIDCAELNPYELACAVFIARKTMGWGKQSDGISKKQFVDSLGMSKNTAKKSINSLIEKGIIQQEHQKRSNGAHSYNKYSFTKSFIERANQGQFSTDEVGHEMTEGRSRDDLGVGHEMTPQNKLIQNKLDNSKKTNKKASNKSFASTEHIENEFTRLWRDMCLRKVGKQSALKAFKKLSKGKTSEEVTKATTGIIADIEKRKDWIEGYESPFHNMHLSTYLNNKRWEDEDMPQRWTKPTTQPASSKNITGAGDNTALRVAMELAEENGTSDQFDFDAIAKEMNDMREMNCGEEF